MTARAPAAALGQTEFIALMAVLAATVAFSVDSMLPALPEIAAELSPDAPNRAQLVVTSFVFGMGAGTFIAGPVSDALGRRTVLFAGALIYSVGACLAWAADSLEFIVAARVLQGLGAAAPRVVVVAIVRDLYGGRNMARIMSIVMMAFNLIPALAPTMGAGIIAAFGWRAIFGAFLTFILIEVIWLGLRLPETLPPAARRPLRFRSLADATAEMLRNQTARLSILVQTLSFGMLFAMISSVQQVFDQTFERATQFPYWFGAIAIVAMSASLLNARLVVRLGMRPLVKGMLGLQVLLTVAMIFAWIAAPEGWRFAVFLVWTAGVFFQTGLTIGNLNALAMEPMGHIAGLAASVISALSTVGAVMLAAPIGLAFDGTPLPLAIGIGVLALLARIFAGRIRRESD